MRYRYMLPTLLLCGMSLLLAACQPEQKTTTEVTGPLSVTTSPAVRVAEQRLMRDHDSLMVRTGQLFGLRQRLHTIRPALLLDSAQPMNRSRLRQLDRALQGLQAADDAMMDWMHAYRAPAATTPPDSALAYYRRQEAVLATLDRQTRISQDSAQVVIRAHAVAPVTNSTR